MCLVDSPKNIDSPIRKTGKKGSPIDLNNWTFFDLPLGILPLTRMGTQQAPGLVPLSSNS